MISLSKIFLVFIRIGLYSFNAGASETLLTQIVEKRRWIDHLEYARVLSLVTLIPGPFHVNLVIATGYTLAGFGGSLVSVIAFVLPGFLIALGIAHALDLTPVSGWLHKNPGITMGVVAVVAGILLSAIARLGIRAIRDRKSWWLVAALATGILLFKFPFAFVICFTGLLYALVHFRKVRNS